MEKKKRYLVHLADQSIDVLLTVTGITTLDEVPELPSMEATSGVGELEGPQEVGGLLEVGANGVDLVDEILDTDNSVLAKSVLNDLVVRQSDSLLVNLAVTTLVDELADGLEVRVTVSDVRVDDGEHLRGSLVQTDEDTVVDLKKSEKLEDLPGLGRDLVNTADTSLAGVGMRRKTASPYPLIRTTKTSLCSSGT